MGQRSASLCRTIDGRAVQVVTDRHTRVRTHTHTCTHVCIRECMQACINAHAYAGIQTHMRTDMCACLCTYVDTRTCMCRHIHACTHMHAYMHTHAHRHVYTHEHTCMHTCTYMCAHTYTHSHTHTRVCAHGLSGVAPFMVTRGARPSHMDGSGLPLHVAAIAKTSSFCEGGRREGPSFLPASRTGLRPRNLLVTKLAQASTGCGWPAQ